MKKSVHSRQRIAAKRIEELFEQAAVRSAFAKRYVAIARKISSRHKTPIPAKWKWRFCRACSVFWIPGRNCRVRKKSSVIVMTCLECGAVRRKAVR